MDGSQLFAINEEEISHNAFDDETIVIHFRTGNYFSLKDSASAIWKVLKDQPASADSIASAFSETPDDASRDVGQFLATLHENGLLRDATEEKQAASPGELGPYQSPKVDIFDDMQEMLLGDIIHDPNEEGWPNIG